LEKITFNNREINFENTFNLVWKMNLELKFRTLDALHVGAAIQMRIFDNIKIQYFLTNDQNILQHKEEIFQKSRILPINTPDLLKLFQSNSTKKHTFTIK
jgi:hypothetical protein